MCKSGGGSPPVPSAASTTFNSTVTPNPPAGALYTDFLNRANALSNTPFNPAMLGTVAPMNPSQLQAGQQLFGLGMDMGNFDPAKVQSIMSPFTESVVEATQNWFNNQNAIQGNDLLSQAIRSGNAFGGDRAGIAEGILSGQQQLAQAPVIAGLRQAGYTQALDEYNRLKQFGLQGAGAALGWGGLQQQQQQREFDVAQQNAMMSSAYPFQTLNWYGSILGGIAPLLGTTASGANNPPEQSGLGGALGVGSAAVGLGSAALGAFGGGGGSAPGVGPGGKRGGIVGHGGIGSYARGGGIVDLEPGEWRYAEGGSVWGDSDDEDRPSESKAESYSREPEPFRPPETTSTTAGGSWGRNVGQLKTSARQLPQPVFPSAGGGGGGQQKSEAEQWLNLGKGALDLGIKAAPYLAMLSDPKTKTDVQRVGRTDDGEPLYGFRYRGDPKSYPKVVGPMARPMAWGGYIPRFADGGPTDEDDQLTLTDLGVLSPGGRELPPSIAGPVRGSPGGLPVSAEDMPNLARVRERFRPVLENDPKLARQFDVNTTAEVGTDPGARRFYQALTLDRAAARGESLPYTLSRGPGTPDRFYPASTMAATRPSGMGPAPSLWMGANPANYGTGNASYDPRTGRHVGFAGGPQTGSIQTGSGIERAGVEGPDLPAVRRWGYAGPTRTAIGPSGPQGTGVISAKMIDRGEQLETGPSAATGPGGTRSSGERTGSMQPSLRAGETKDYPSLAKPAPTFAQRLATNPFWQFGTALMAKPGIKGRELSAIGGAAQFMSEQQIKERNRVLDEKPQMIKQDDGSIGFLSSDGKFTQMFGPSASEQREAQKHARDMSLPKEVTTEREGRFGSTQTIKTPYVWDERQQKMVPMNPAATPQPETPQVAPPAAPPQPPAATPPQQPAPDQPAPPTSQRPVRQTQAAEPTDWMEIGANTGTFYSASTQQYKQPDGSIVPALDKGVRPTIPSQTPAASGPAVAAEGPGLQNTQRAWTSGEVAPAGSITDPAALAVRRNEAALAGLSPEDQQTIKNIVDYKADPNKLFVGRTANLRDPAMRKALEYDPTYNPQLLAQRQKAAVAFGVNGVEARNIQSHDTAIQHLGRAMTNIERLNNYDYQWVNQARDWAQKKIPGMRDPALQQAIGALDFDYHAVASELMRAFRGTGSASEREAHRIAEKLNVYAPLDVQRETIREATELLYGRVEASAKTYNSAVGPGYERSPESWLSGKSRETLGRAISIDPNKPIPAAPTSGATPQQPQGPGALSAEDQKAVDWARRNSDNPKAKEILQLHGLQ